MIFDMLSRLARVRFTVGYAATLAAVSIALLILGPQAREQVVRNASTNLHNLAHGKLETLFGSAFVTDAGPMWFWLPGLVCLLALAELIWRTGRLSVVFLTGHVGATLLVAAGLTAAVEFAWLPLSISRASDVGMSYGAVAVLGALTTAIPRRWRPAWVGWWVPAGIAAAVAGTDFTDAGHAVALVLGMLVATRFAGPVRWTRVRYVLLGVGSAFGFMLLAHTGWSVLAGVSVGAVGAVAADGMVRLRMMRRLLAVPAPAVPQPLSLG
ncbi:MAG: rhomboid-like protein [Mycobacterium sp.]